MEGVDAAIARTAPPFDGRPLVNEIERLYLDQVAAARRTIYVESQYFAAGSVIDALEGRLREPEGPEIVVINPQSALSTVEDRAMHVLRGRAIDRLRAADRHGDRFRILHPVDAAGEPIYVHAKVFVVDDRVLRVGSSNLDDRSMGFDTECDLAVAPPRGGAGVVAAFRTRLLAEHLGVAPAAPGPAGRGRGAGAGGMAALARAAAPGRAAALTRTAGRQRVNTSAL
jgi:phospholipase D1/2